MGKVKEGEGGGFETVFFDLDGFSLGFKLRRARRGMSLVHIAKFPGC